MTSTYNHFVNRVTKQQQQKILMENNFIFSSTSATTIYIPRYDAEQNVALILTPKVDSDLASLFTQAGEPPMVKGDYFTWRDHIFFIFQEVPIVRETAYHKYSCYECNATTIVDGVEVPLYFSSNLTQRLDTKLVDNLIITDDVEIMLIFPNTDLISLNSFLAIEEEVYQIVGLSTVGNKGITYATAKRTFKDKPIVIEDIPTNDFASAVTCNSIFAVETHSGYILAPANVEIVSRSANVVELRAPKQPDNFTLETRDSSGESITLLYKAVLEC